MIQQTVIRGNEVPPIGGAFAMSCVCYGCFSDRLKLIKRRGYRIALTALDQSANFVSGQDIVQPRVNVKISQQT